VSRINTKAQLLVKTKAFRIITTVGITLSVFVLFNIITEEESEIETVMEEFVNVSGKYLESQKNLRNKGTSIEETSE